MTGFSADWLALREPADKASRSPVVLDAVREAFADWQGDRLRICDLGSGTGASVDAFSCLFPFSQCWHLVDNDVANLKHAEARYSGDTALENVRIETRVHDLSVDPVPWTGSTRLVTATALFDLVSPEWLREFASRLSADNLPLLATLTYDGRLALAPELPFDVEMIRAFNRHQQTDKGFGRAVGPLATTVLGEALQERGYELVTGDSAWRLDGVADWAMIHAIFDGWAAAADEMKLLCPASVADWLEARKKNTTSLVVGHLDLFAKPVG